MERIYQFPESRIVHRRTPQKPKREGPWRLGDLDGRKPKGHPALKRGPRGKVLLALGQVWVENHNDELWVLAHFEDGHHGGTFTHRVWLRPYGSRKPYYRELAEQSFRGSMKVWEDALTFRTECVEHLKRSVTGGEGRAFFDSEEAAFAFFGISPKTGNRTD